MLISAAQIKMQDCLNQLGIDLKVIWKPDNSKTIHGEIQGNLIMLYDSEEQEAWATLTHEVIEFKLKAVTCPYRLLVNGLIETVEKIVYSEKEKYIDSMPKMIELIKNIKQTESSRENSNCQ